MGDITQRFPSIMTSTARYDAEKTRVQLVKRGFLRENVVRYLYRPFDVRWLYWEPEGKLLDEKRPEYFPQLFEGNIWLEARQQQPMAKFDRGLYTTVLGDNFGNGLSSFFPLYKKNVAGDLFEAPQSSDKPQPNLADTAKEMLAGLEGTPEELFFHILAVLHTPKYREENADALRRDWPRIPFPETRERLSASAALGRQVAALLDSETPVPGVTCGKLSDVLKPMGVLKHREGRAVRSEELAVTAGWGHAGKGGVTMPGRGKTEEHEDGSVDVFLNGDVYWANVPGTVWEYTSGGYQVVKKWLSYREQPLLERPLQDGEARYVSEMIRRIAALLDLGPVLDANYAECYLPSRSSRS